MNGYKQALAVSVDSKVLYTKGRKQAHESYDQGMSAADMEHLRLNNVEVRRVDHVQRRVRQAVAFEREAFITVAGHRSAARISNSGAADVIRDRILQPF